MKSKKGVSLSIQTIILLILGLIVIGILFFLLTSTSKEAGKTVFDCEPKAKCEPNPPGCVGAPQVPGKCPNNQICCLKKVDNG